MNAIEIMMNEHRYIERMLKVVRAACFKVSKNDIYDYSDFDLIIGFIKEYADGHHHNKEERFLFNKMVENLGVLGEKLVKHGMLVEHDFGRLYVRNLEEALKKVKAGDEEAKLDLIANAISYCDLLTRHIDKEDRVVYTFAKRELKEEIMIQVDAQCAEYEREYESVSYKNIEILEVLESKYLL
ncbi:hemerythrin domain-containing protein [Clostridium butyricum]|uniref:hemerythrin domain-containing protein n=1 Tax=Clostridium butyricum TaxID=1492 RepID=UPI003466A3D5